MISNLFLGFPNFPMFLANTFSNTLRVPAAAFCKIGWPKTMGNLEILRKFGNHRETFGNFGNTAFCKIGWPKTFGNLEILGKSRKSLGNIRNIGKHSVLQNRLAKNIWKLGNPRKNRNH
jgi:hypothetical protein